MPLLDKIWPWKLSPYFVIPGLGNERGEAIVRLTGALVVTGYAIFNAMRPDTQLSQSQLEFATIGLAAYLGVAIAALVACERDWGKALPRQVCMAIADQVFVAVLLYGVGTVLLPFLFAPICMSLGAGLRYGRSCGVLASAASTFCIGTALVYSAYWQSYAQFFPALMLVVCVVPYYIFRLTDRLAESMRTDVLTKITNRMGYDELLDKLCTSAERNPESAALIFLDLDGFKKINDEAGHDAGDGVLTSVAKLLTKSFSGIGMPARLGGDEFAIIADKFGSTAQLERLIEDFLRAVRKIGSDGGYPLSASVGVFYFSHKLPTTRGFASKAADSLLYLSKGLKKNQFNTSAGRRFNSEGKLIAERKNSGDVEVHQHKK